MRKKEIPRKTIYRLSLYLRCLQRLKENGMVTVSSQALAKGAGVKSPQLRKDLAYFGHFGTRGLGYKVEVLSEVITEVLGTARLQPVVLAGIGNLGSALLTYTGFHKEGFEIVAGFDVDPARARERGVRIPVHEAGELASFVSKNGVKMGIITVPGNHGQAVANDMIDGGIQAILNFSPIVLDVPEKVVVNSVDLALELENLSYFAR